MKMVEERSRKLVDEFVVDIRRLKCPVIFGRPLHDLVVGSTVARARYLSN